MNEKEIIEYLKQNKEKGIALGFMPEEVQVWVKEHRNEDIFMCFSIRKWERYEQIACAEDSVYALIDDYEPKPKFEPHWEEFDIDEEGCFNFCNVYSFWHQWSAFLSLNKDKYNAFGGWLFGDKLWSTKLLVTDMAKRELFESATKDIAVMPVRPTKIRFWRHKE